MKKSRNLLRGISILPALLVMPAMATSVHAILADGYDDVLTLDSKTSDWGAYIASGSSAKLKEGSALTSNSASFGGALMNLGGNLTAQGTGFTGNTATQSGGAVYNTGEMSVGGVFTRNEADSWGGAIYNAGHLIVSDNTAFNYNKAGSVGGAITNALGTSVLSLGANVQFIGNEAVNDGGAIGNYAGAVLVNGTTFTGNKAQTGETDSDAIGGGAMSLGAESTTNIKNAMFDSNVSGFNGGAIGTRHALSADNTAAKLDIDSSVFVGNKATGTVESTFGHGSATGGNGGALDNHFYNSDTKEGYAYLGNTTFTSNEAVNGGAIYNDGTLDQASSMASLYLEKVTFTNNVATTNGGAIYNDGLLMLAGTNTFTGNTANGVANDIYNAGTLTFAENSTTTMDGGIAGTGDLTVANGATLNIGTADLTQDTFALNGTLVARVRDGDTAQLNVGTFSGNGTLSLLFGNPGTYHVFGVDVFAAAKDQVTSAIYDISWENSDKDIVAALKSTEEIAASNNLSAETATAVVGMSQSTSATLNDLAVAIQEKLADNTEAARQEVKQATAAINPETESVVQSVSSSVQNTVTSLASGRMSMPTVGRSGGDVKMTSGGVWAQGIFNKTKQNDAFNGYTRGIAAGMDGTINKNWTIGAGYAFAHSDVNATARDTEIDSSSVFLYGQYKPSAWYVNAVANYTMSDYSEKGVALGTGITADYDVNAFGANVATGYDFAGGITPELALRYMHVDASDYTNSLGIHNKLDSSDYLTATLGTKYAFDVKATKSLTLRPELRYAVKYDVMSDKQVATVTMPGVNSYVLDGERLSRIGGEFGIGMGVNYKGFDLSLNYDIEAREDYTSQSGRVKFRYNF